MAFKRKRFTKNRKRFTQRKRARGKRRGSKRSPFAATIIRGRDWISNSLMNKMEYMEQVFYTAVTSPQVYVFRGNSIFDPNQTGTGTQPLGMANLSAIYTYYECPSSFIRVEFINNTSIPCWITITPVVNAIDVNTYNSSQGRPGGRNKYCEGNQGRQHTIITNRCSNKKMRDAINGTGDTRTTIGTNPTDQWYWSISIQPCDFASVISGVLNIKLIYH